MFHPWRDGGRMLDVGCGNGAYLAKMRAYGWAVTGQEVDEAAADTARRLYDVDVLVAPVARIPDMCEPFDVVTASHVIEHVVDPRAFLRDALACLRPGGRLVILTPNVRALGHRWFGRDWYPLDTPRHLAVYSPKGLAYLARATPGMTSIEVRSSPSRAAKMYRLGTEVRRHGRFRSGLPEPGWVRAGARTFGFVERAASRVGSFGEELTLVGRRS